MNKYYMYGRIVPKKDYVTNTGKLGWRDHVEVVFIDAETPEEADLLIKPFNYKKHIKFRSQGEIELGGMYECNSIIDFGPVTD